VQPFASVTSKELLPADKPLKTPEVFVIAPKLKV
jgi:hypothetical protein